MRRHARAAGSARCIGNEGVHARTYAVYAPTSAQTTPIRVRRSIGAGANRDVTSPLRAPCSHPWSRPLSQF
eukprot:3222592-Pyramimonas_sp.AAC.1